MNAIYEAPELGKTPANHVPLSPISMLKRTAQGHPDQVATIHGASIRTWAEVERRCRRLASALQQRGVSKGDTVAVLAPNIPELLECHFAIPMSGAVLNANNTRLEAKTIAYILDHSEASVFLVDTEYAGLAAAALEHCRERLDGSKRPKRMVIGELPKTSTGKIRKNELRDQARLVS